MNKLIEFIYFLLFLLFLIVIECRKRWSEWLL